jgi:hypothetical protein
LQVAYVAAAARYGVIISIDGLGAVTLHFPMEENGDTELRHGEEVFIRSYALDNAPAFERFYMVTANVGIDPSRMVATIKNTFQGDSLRALHLPDEYHQFRITLLKPKEGQ